ncbi:TonB-dependent receptor plug domain-containing protein [Cyclobacterium sp. SYSU L10401]|uniref:TonB-dependent receptor plug domain-containing protein n=1 Tax=Cyclobacterium sp. SYSU L10401 TaxID=2678657 RepID=UPI0013D2393C|nr:TonB-dependent receptor [Cyclobacterium sp. SYSU L10401]
MCRINLNKNSFACLLMGCLLFPFLTLASDPICIRDQAGKPIPHAYVKIGPDKVVPVDSTGSFELPDNLEDDQLIEVFAMGFDARQILVREISELSSLLLTEKIGQMGEVVVAATRTDRSVEDLPMPVTVISRKQIQETGGMRLSEVLREQTGLQVVSDHGSGLQMQGLSSDYILILLDGEPLIGRTAGTFDLDRISVTNIERIEVLRGPSSAIYGSEAMAGVINIITKSNGQPFAASLESRFRSFSTMDLSGEASFNQNDWSVQAYLNRFRTDGFDLNPDVPGNTQAPFQATTGQVKLGKKSGKWEFRIYSRMYREDSENVLQINENGTGRLADLSSERRDLNLNPTVTYRPNEHWQLTLRSMTSVFETHSLTEMQEDDFVVDAQDFQQRYHRTEFQLDRQLENNQLLTLGMGHLLETVDATRYEDLNRFDAGYLYLQHQWDPTDRWNIVTGVRGDLHSQYGERISPKISWMYKFSEKFSWQASLGAGFKAPDFRQLLLNFNNASAGYYVFGANMVQEGIERLQSQGLVQQLLLDPSQFGALQAESSLAINTGFRWKLSNDLLLQGNFFQNNISNLIETAPFARLTSGQNAFSYFNVSRVRTRGIELDWTWRLTSHLQVSAGYMYLDANDLDVLEQIDSGELFRRDSENRTQRVSRSDYGGLFNRSRHSGNLKISYQEPVSGINLALRAIHRGTFGFGDVNGNLILDDPSEYAQAMTSWNLSLSKTLSNGLLLETGGFNLLNQLNQYEPSNPGRTLFVGAKVPFHQLVNSK